MPLKCLTIRQPWAWAIIHGHKPVENRSWSCGYRGRLAIHAGSSRRSLAEGLRILERAGIEVPDDTLVFGAILGTVELIDIVPHRLARKGWHTEGPLCWILADPRPLKRPIPAIGRLGLYDAPRSKALLESALSSSPSPTRRSRTSR